MVFLSYSREQLYFAETLCVRLQKAGVPVWMDLQRLEPGGDWREQIRVALEGCTALILVASRTALNSPYVEQEWQAVRRCGKPVYIAFFEEVLLPQALKDSALVDFRGSFGRGLRLLADALKHGRDVREPAQKPGWLNLPRRLPPAIRLSAWMLILAAILAPIIAPGVRFPAISPSFWSVYSFFISGMCLWLWWKLVHRRLVFTAGLVGLSLPYFYVAFSFFSTSVQAGMSDEFFGRWMGYVLFGIVYVGILYFIAGADFLHWSIPTEDANLQTIRRWINKARREKRKPAAEADFQGVLSARGLGSAVTPALERQRMRMDNPAAQIRASAQTYHLVYARADRPVALSVRRAFGRQKLREVNSGGEALIVILSEYLPRSDLADILDSSVHAIVLLSGNIILQGDPFLERITHLQLVDYRDRSGKILPALGRAIKNPADSRALMAVEVTPKPLNQIRLPLTLRQIGYYVSILGAFLVLGGMVSMSMMFLGLAPNWRNDLIGLPIGLALLRIGAGYWHRRTTNLFLLPAVAFSTWLGMAIFFTSFFMFSTGLPTRVPELIFTLSDIFALEGWICFSAPVVMMFVPIILLNLASQLRDWLPALASRAGREDRFVPLPDPDARRWRRNAWLWAVFLIFGLGPAMYGLFWFIINVMSDF